MAFPDFSDLLARTRTVLNETTAAFWTDAELKRWLNEGERDIAAKAECIENVDTGVVIPTTTRVVPFSGYKVKYVEHVPTAGAPIGLQKINMKQLGKLPFNGVIPQYWFQWGSTVGNCIIIDPYPATATGTLNIYVADYPVNEMYDDTDEPQVPYEFHELIVDYAVYMALWKAKKWGQSAQVYQRYISILNGLRTKYVEHEVDYKETIAVPDAIEYRQAG
jgi:hypothetical protein